MRAREMPRVVDGRYGLSSKEFTPAMVEAVLRELRGPASRHPFTVGIDDDVTHLSLPVDAALDIEPPRCQAGLVLRPGLGRHGRREQEHHQDHRRDDRDHAQGYFVYDSKKSGAVTVSHLRFGPRPIQRAYLIEQAGFVACHQFELLERLRRAGTCGAGRRPAAQRAG